MKMKTMLFTLILTLIVGSAFADSLKLPGLHGSDQEAGSGESVSLIAGKVVETMDSGGYSYVKLENNGKSTWLAVPKMKITVGQEASFLPGAVMHDFNSKTLNRTFDTIIFSSGPAAGSAAVTDYGSPHGGMVPAPDVEIIKVEKASGTNAYTVAELHENMDKLDNKKITVKGQVVKVSPSIMKKNWVHIQDGSGSAAKGNSKIIVTTQDLPSVGDVVTANGILYKDKDFGYGYKYSVIVEEGSITK